MEHKHPLLAEAINAETHLTAMKARLKAYAGQLSQDRLLYRKDGNVNKLTELSDKVMFLTHLDVFISGEPGVTSLRDVWVELTNDISAF